MTTGAGVDIIGIWYGTGIDRGCAFIYCYWNGLIVTLITMRSRSYRNYQELSSALEGYRRCAVQALAVPAYLSGVILQVLRCRIPERGQEQRCGFTSVIMGFLACCVTLGRGKNRIQGEPEI